MYASKSLYTGKMPSGWPMYNQCVTDFNAYVQVSVSLAYIATVEKNRFQERFKCMTYRSAGEPARLSLAVI